MGDSQNDIIRGAPRGPIAGLSKGGAPRALGSSRDGAGCRSVFLGKNPCNRTSRGDNFSRWRSSRAPEASHLGKIGLMTHSAADSFVRNSAWIL
jgi:hypothetical protein